MREEGIVVHEDECDEGEEEQASEGEKDDARARERRRHPSFVVLHGVEAFTLRPRDGGDMHRDGERKEDQRFSIPLQESRPPEKPNTEILGSRRNAIDVSRSHRPARNCNITSQKSAVDKPETTQLHHKSEVHHRRRSSSTGDRRRKGKT